MKKHKRGLYALFIVLAFIAALIILWGRVRDEKALNTVELSLDYDSYSDLCKEEGIPLAQGFKDASTAGITSLSVNEMTLDQLQDQGKLRWMTGSQLADYITLSGTDVSNLNIDPSSIYVFNCNPVIEKAIRSYFSLMEKKGILTDKTMTIGSSGKESGGAKTLPVMEIKGSIKLLPYKGLGFDPEKTAEISNLGFNLNLRPENKPDASADQIKDYIAQINKIKGVTCIIFAGANEVIGYPTNLDATVDGFKQSHHLSLGDVETPNEKMRQKGATYLAQKLTDRVVRVQSIIPQYLEKMLPEDAIDIFRLGVRERNIRLIYLRPYTRSVDRVSVYQTNIDYFSMLKKEITRYGFTTGAASRMPVKNPPMILVILISLGTAGVLLLLLEQFHYDKGIIAAIVLPASVILPAGLIILGKIGLAQKLIGLPLGILFPTYAIVSAFEEMGFIETRKKLIQVLGYAVKMFLKISMITMLGALILAALFSSTEFMLAIDRVKGVKAILFAPPVICFVLYYLRGSANRQSLKDILSSPIYMWQGIAAAFLGLIAAIVAIRSGNADESLASNSERQLRVLMEQLFWVRPRFKDFMLGHPAMIITWALTAMNVFGGMGIFVLFGAIGQADIMDTFSHVHTPVIISLARTVSGMLIGLVIGVLAVTCYWYGRRLSAPKKAA
ncbi:MAG: DUF5693 family protein [Firmicutes bacterium]|nr:DUF5693 family protein [Bacillota bacterium]